MNISGIRPQMGFYSYNSISTQQAKGAQELEQEQTQLQALSEESVSTPSSEVDSSRESSKQSFGAYDYAMQYDPTATYSLKGADSDLESLDVERAISGMQKDAVLHQYQYFVGANASEADAAGAMRQTEDFSL